MKKTYAYDLPTRIFHWFFALLFVTAFTIAETVGEENPLFSYHMMAGLTVGFLIVLRLVWGFIGTTYARFSSFKMNPVELIRYLKDAVVSKTKRYFGHNPASSYAAVIMFISAIGLAITGIQMTGGGESEFYEATHKLLADIFLITAIVHVAGIFFHHIKHKDALWSSMLDGMKKVLPGKQGITSTKRFAGIVFFVLTLAWIGYLNNQYNRNTHTLDLFGKQLTLGEAEHESQEVEGNRELEDEEAEDD